MCGIVGILGTTPVASSIVDALKRLEYRGYDSAGVATLEGGRLARRRAEGKLRNLEARLLRAFAARRARSASATPAGRRTGKPTERNAHPHATDRWRSSTTASSRISASCAASWRPRAGGFESETDTEVVAHLVTPRARGRGERSGARPSSAIRCRGCAGAFALAFLFEGEETC
jgi:glucosamine--fructose-6-phosphate aminotransferase (isomerizing)